MIRQFTLYNSLGQSCDLNSLKHFFHEISGLGQEHNVSYELINNIFIKTEDVLKQKRVKGKIRFIDYEEFEKFSLFIQYKPLVLEYRTRNAYSMIVSIDKLEKTELELIGLDCHVEFRGLTTWYRNIVKQNLAKTHGKIYPYTYDYPYTDNRIGEISFINDSCMDCHVKLILYGPLTNPSWHHYLDGNAVVDGKIGSSTNPVTISKDNQLVIDTTSIPYTITEKDSVGNVLRNLYGESDFSSGRFIVGGMGNNKVVFSHEGLNDIAAKIEARIEYESV